MYLSIENARSWRRLQEIAEVGELSPSRKRFPLWRKLTKKFTVFTANLNRSSCASSVVIFLIKLVTNFVLFVCPGTNGWPSDKMPTISSVLLDAYTLDADTLDAETLYVDSLDADEFDSDIRFSNSLISRSSSSLSISLSCSILFRRLFSNSDLRSAVLMISVMTLIPFLFPLRFPASLAELISEM